MSSGGSVAHIESLWTLIITSLVRSSSADLILASKNGFITILTVFASVCIHHVVALGFSFIGFWSICMKYMCFSTRYVTHVWSTHPSIRWQLVPLLSWTPSKQDCYTFSGRKTYVDHFRSRSRHLCASTHRPGPCEHISFKILVIALPRH